MKYIITATAMLIATQASAAEPYGVWQTITDETGAHLLVNVHPCETDEAKLCGTIAEVVDSSNPAAKDLINRPIFWDLEPAEENHWDNGTVFDVPSGKEYNSRVILGKAALRVEGCVATFCDGQNWKRPKE